MTLQGATWPLPDSADAPELKDRQPAVPKGVDSVAKNEWESRMRINQ